MSDRQSTDLSVTSRTTIVAVFGAAGVGEKGNSASASVSAENDDAAVMAVAAASSIGGAVSVLADRPPLLVKAAATVAVGISVWRKGMSERTNALAIKSGSQQRIDRWTTG